MEALGLAALVAATITSGLLAGVFVFYAHTVIGDSTVWWIVAALVLNVVMILVTAREHLPRNDALKTAAEIGADSTVARATFDEDRWVHWNLLRVLTSTTTCVLLSAALVVAGTHR